MLDENLNKKKLSINKTVGSLSTEGLAKTHGKSKNRIKEYIV